MLYGALFAPWYSVKPSVDSVVKKMFTKIGNSTKVISELNFDSKEDLDKILKTGFEKDFLRTRAN